MLLCHIWQAPLIMTKIFIFTSLWPNYPPYFLIVCYFERRCLYNREISLAAHCSNNLQNRKNNMTKNCDKIVNCDIFKKNNMNLYKTIVTFNLNNSLKFS